MKNDKECTENRKSEEISYLEEEMASEEDESILESHQSRIEQLRRDKASYNDCEVLAHQ